MSTGVVAAGAAAVAAYMYYRRAQNDVNREQVELSLPVETHTNANVERPPTTWTEALYLFSEAIRYFYNETLGRWHTLDLFLGLAYLSQRDTPEYPAADIARQGRNLLSDCDAEDAPKLMEQLVELRRVLLYCQGLKRRPNMQLRHWQETMGIEPEDVLRQQATSGLLRPAFVIVRDRTVRAIMLCVRGTHSMKDLFTSLTGATKPHHQIEPTGVVLGYSHLGMLASARYLLKQVTPDLQKAMTDNPGYKLLVVGHSMGGGTAAMLTMMMRDHLPEFGSAHCYAVACPACMTLELAQSCKGYVTTLINGTDIVPSFCPSSVDALREQVMHSTWFVEFQRDARTRVQRMWLESLRGVGSATMWTTRNLLSPAAQPFRACYGPRQKQGPQQPSLSRSHSPTQPMDLDSDTRAAAATQSLLAAALAHQPDSPPLDPTSPPSPSPSPSPSGLPPSAASTPAQHHTAAGRGPAPWADAGAAGGSSLIASDGSRVTAVQLDCSSPPSTSRTHSASSVLALLASVGSVTAAGGTADGSGSMRPYGGVGELRRRLWPFRAGGIAVSCGGAQADAGAGGPPPPQSPSRGMPDEKAVAGTSWRQQVGSMGLQATRVVRHSVASTSQIVAQRASNLIFQSLFAACRAPSRAPSSTQPLLGGDDRQHSQHAQHSEGGMEGAAATAPQPEQMTTTSSEDEEDADVSFTAAANQERQDSLGLGVSAVVAAVSAEASAQQQEEEQTTAQQVLNEAGAPEEDPDADMLDAPELGLGGDDAVAAADGAPPSPRPTVVDPLHHHWKRKMYPAGRILHIMPGFALLPPTAQAQPDTPSAPTSAAEADATGASSTPASGSPLSAADAAGQEDTGPAAAAAAAAQRADAMDGDAADPGVGTAAAAGASSDGYVLLEVSANDAYCRVKLCKTMVMDHFIPPTLAALDAVIAQLRSQFGQQDAPEPQPQLTVATEQ